MAIEEKNAVIERTMLGFEDRGILTYYIYLDYSGAGQAFGGYELDGPVYSKDVPNLQPWENENRGRFIRRQGRGFGADAILLLLKTLGVKSWEKLPGTPCRVRAEHSKVHAIGHYLNDEWLDLEKLYREEWAKKEDYLV